MKTIREMCVRMELVFWGFTIPMLRESPLLRRALHLAYPVFASLSWTARLPRPVLWVGTGLTLGFVIGFFGAIVLP